MSVGTKTIDRDSTIEDICDFVVEYINSDMLVSVALNNTPRTYLTSAALQGLLADRHLVIADQSKVNEPVIDLMRHAH